MDTGTKGAANEYYVTLDLWKRNFEVYRNMSTTGATDIIATKEIDGSSMLTVRVQVKSVKSGRLDANEMSMNDVLAIVADDGSVRYRVTPGLVTYFPDALPVNLNNSDRFAFTGHYKNQQTIFGTLGFKICGFDDKTIIWLGREDQKPLRKFIFPTPNGTTKEVFSDKVSTEAQRLLDEAKNPAALEEAFKDFPAIVQAEELPEE